MMTKKDGKDFENSARSQIRDVYVDGNVKVRDYCHIIGNYRGSAHRYCNIEGK